MADSSIRVTASLAAQNTGTDWLRLRGERNRFDISISGTFAATVHMQRKRPGEADSAARDVENYTTGTERLGEMQGHWDVRLFVKPGNFTSGTVVAELGV